MESDGRIQGHVDGCRDGLIHGWALDRDRPGEPVIVEMVVNGVVVGDALARLGRGDLAEAGYPDCAFALACDQAFLDGWPGGGFEAQIRARGGAAIPGGLLELDDGAVRGAAGADFGAWPELAWTVGGGAEGFVDRFDGSFIGGWIYVAADPSPPVRIDVWEGDDLAGSVTAAIWRPDLAASRQGDGRWGFLGQMPQHLADGRLHRLELRLADGRAILLGPVHVRLAALDTARRSAVAAQLRPAHTAPYAPRLRPRCPVAPGDTMFSFVVNFYNMKREAARTLTSLTRQYQRAIDDLRYEVLCVDNGSDPPLDAEWVASFGAEFRLVRPSRLSASPCAALNEAAAQASGRYVAMMIDGAHILTPGVLREVWDAVTEAPDAVVALRQWFVGGDQRWLSDVGYSTRQEDILFDRIAWPADGYGLFEISKPVWESPSHWLNDVGESNCLFMPARVFAAIGGFDEAFEEAGAGFANLDLLGRAVAESTEPLVALVGEATFHQFHGGTTTNVTDSVKDQRVWSYENQYVALRGRPYRSENAFNVRLRGRLPSFGALMTRQNPLSPVQLSVTERVRPTKAVLHFDSGAQDYANSVYAEAGLHQRATWLGRPMGVAPSDALTMQEIIFRQRPERIVAVNLAPGLMFFLESVAGLCDGLACGLVCVSVAAQTDVPRGCVCLEGDPASAKVLQGVQRALGSAERVLVVFSPNPGDLIPDAMMCAYASFVSPRSYLIFSGSVFSQPWLGYSANWYNTAIRRLVRTLPFVVDEFANPHLISTSPMGYLQRIGSLQTQD